MCRNATVHKEFMATVKQLDTLCGSANSKRRLLKRAHTEQDGNCVWCGVETYLWWEVTTAEFKELDVNTQATCEHMITQSSGGFLSDDNITCACFSCNQIRGSIEQNQFKWVTQNPERFARYMTKRQANIETQKANKRLNKYIRLLKYRSAKAEENFNNQLVRSLNDISLFHQRQQDRINKKATRKMSKHQENVKASCAEKNMNQISGKAKNVPRKANMTKAAIRRKNSEYEARMKVLREEIAQDKLDLENLSWFNRLVNRLVGDIDAKSNKATA